MKLNVFAGTTVVPTLSRLILALAFITAGYQKVTGTSEFSVEQKTVLEGLGIPLTEIAPGADTQSSLETGTETGARAVFASLRQDDPGDPGQEDPTQEPPGQATADDPAAAKKTAEEPPAKAQETPPPAVAPPPAAVDPPPPAAEPPPSAERVLEPPAVRVEVELPEGEVITIDTEVSKAVYQGRSLWGIAYLCETRGLPAPRQMAWVAALTELIGGSLLLIGFLSRIWGLGLAIAMGTAVYLTTLDPYLAAGPFAVAAKSDHVLFNTLFSQLGLGLLAFGILLTGAGPLSLDRVIFRRRGGASTSSALSEDDYGTES